MLSDVLKLDSGTGDLSGATIRAILLFLVCQRSRFPTPEMIAVERMSDA